MDDNDEYIDISNLLKPTIDTYQLQCENNKLKIKHVGVTEYMFDIKINEIKKNEIVYSIYSCIYSLDEILSQNEFLLLKIIEQRPDNTNIISGICIKPDIQLNSDNINLEHTFSTCYIKSKNETLLTYKKLDKLPDKTEIIEYLFKLHIN